jgi:hypothetical protein
MTRTASVVWSVVEILVALFLMFVAAVLIIVCTGLATDVINNLNGVLGKDVVCWLISAALTVIAIVLYRDSIRRLRSVPMALLVVEISLAGLLVLCAGVIAILGFAVAEGAPHAFPGDLRIGVICWLIALGMTLVAIIWCRRSTRRLGELRLHESEFRSDLQKR